MLHLFLSKTENRVTQNSKTLLGETLTTSKWRVYMRNLWTKKVEQELLKASEELLFCVSSCLLPKERSNASSSWWSSRRVFLLSFSCRSTTSSSHVLRGRLQILERGNFLTTFLQVSPNRATRLFCLNKRKPNVEQILFFSLSLSRVLSSLRRSLASALSFYRQKTFLSLQTFSFVIIAHQQLTHQVIRGNMVFDNKIEDERRA